MKKHSQTLRDPFKPGSHYMKIFETDKKRLSKIGKDSPIAVLGSAARSSLDAGLALYSMGHQADDCLSWLDKAVEYSLLLLKKKDYSFIGYGTMEEDLHLFPAAHLVGRSSELLTAYRKCKFEKPNTTYVWSLFSQMCSLFTGEEVRKLNAGMLADLEKHAKEWLVLPSLFQAAGQKDSKKFTLSLSKYLKEYWPKEVRRIDSSYYVGRWSLLAAATCKTFGCIPELEEAERKFIPVDLVKIA